jgi:hypothetical protein
VRIDLEAHAPLARLLSHLQTPTETPKGQPS